ncbi:MAG: hypothetical protein RPR91_09705, partial [Colwellia sp.]
NVDVIGDFLITFMILSFAVRLYQSVWYGFVRVKYGVELSLGDHAFITFCWRINHRSITALSDE